MVIQRYCVSEINSLQYFSVTVFQMNGEMLLQHLEKKQPLDLLFLDIEMEGIDGIQAGQWIREKSFPSASPTGKK
ncbi:MAG: response regulator [Roseburia sp.]|nr:response regulator [Roseburia sp.]